MVLYSYHLLGIPVTAGLPGQTDRPYGNGFVDCKRDLTWNRAELIAIGGIATCYKLRAVTEVLCENGIACIQLSLDLEDPDTPLLTEEAGRLGFFYAGILPESLQAGHDALQLQFLNGLRVNPDEILLYQESALQVMEYIRNEVPDILTGSGL
jgi:hypothetical protein